MLGLIMVGLIIAT